MDPDRNLSDLSWTTLIDMLQDSFPAYPSPTPFGAWLFHAAMLGIKGV